MGTAEFIDVGTPSGQVHDPDRVKRRVGDLDHIQIEIDTILERLQGGRLTRGAFHGFLHKLGGARHEDGKLVNRLPMQCTKRALLFGEFYRVYDSF